MTDTNEKRLSPWVSAEHVAEEFGVSLRTAYEWPFEPEAPSVSNKLLETVALELGRTTRAPRAGSPEEIQRPRVSRSGERYRQAIHLGHLTRGDGQYDSSVDSATARCAREVRAPVRSCCKGPPGHRW